MRPDGHRHVVRARRAPGEIFALGTELRLLPFAPTPEQAGQCIFELIYFARPDSRVFGHDVAAFRLELGRRLAIEAPAPGDVVVPVPDSAIHGAWGFANASGLDVAPALDRSTAVGRSFIQPTAAARASAVAAKLHVNGRFVYDRWVVLVDDSIVRDNTCLQLVQMLRRAGAREVHVRVTSPPTIAGCHFGIDTPNENELFATGRTLPQMCAALGADSLEFLSLGGLMGAVQDATGFCAGCFSGRYPVDLSERDNAPRAIRVAMKVRGALSGV